MSDFYAAGSDPYCYPGTTILRNRFDICEARLLAEIESVYSQQRLVELYTQHPVTGRFGLTHLSRIHRFIFQDVYPWAGRLRMVRTHKERTTFAYPENIPGEAKRIFDALRQENYLLDLTPAKLSERLAWYIAELNVLHPYREGNGRALRAFLRLLLLRRNMPLHFERLEPAEWLEASVAAYIGNLAPMKSLIAQISEPFV